MKLITFLACTVFFTWTVHALPGNLDGLERRVTLEAEILECFNEADYPGHADINPSDQNKGAKDYEDQLNSDHPIQDWVDYSNNWYRINYHYIAEKDPGCTQDWKYAAGMLTEVYQYCNNGGVGGKIRFGCIVYTFIGGE